MESKNSYPKTVNMAFRFLFIILVLFSCKKDNKNYILQGKVTNPRQSQPLAGASVDLSKQVVGGGTFNGSFNNAASSLTDNAGDYKLEWPRENFAALRLNVSKQDFFPIQIDLPPSDFSAGEEVTRNISLYPKATVQVSINHSNNVSQFDQIEFSFMNAQFDCDCCNNDGKFFQGAVDTTFECLLYGDTWLKYSQEIITSQLDSLVIDSIWCPAFQTTPIGISY
jgi:hypothetical protein